jgi:hypothetical protein
VSMGIGSSLGVIARRAGLSLFPTFRPAINFRYIAICGVFFRPMPCLESGVTPLDLSADAADLGRRLPPCACEIGPGRFLWPA